MDLLIPASGFATRMNRIPKFLLPGDEKGTTLLDIHLRSAQGYYDTIHIATRAELIPLLKEYAFNSNVVITPMETATMTETVLNLIGISKALSFGLIMPDTFFHGDSPHNFLSKTNRPLGLALWKIKDSQRGRLGQVDLVGNSARKIVDKDPTCNFEYSWGAASFTRDFASFFQKEMPHIGYAFQPAIDQNVENICQVVNGRYFDCGTPQEYFELIRTIGA